MLKSKTMNIHKEGDLVFLSFPKIDASGVASCVFSTKFGGVGTDDFATMNMSFSRGDSEDTVLENYRRLCSAAGIDSERLIFTKQTHSTNVEVADLKYLGNKTPVDENYNDIDGLITDMAGVGLVSQYADCVPLVFCDPIKRIVATSHAGWRGTVGKIAEVTVKKMKSDFDCNPKDIIAGIGPSVGLCCYEVDDPVMEKVKALDGIDLSRVYTEKGNGKYMLDLKELNRRIMIKSGICPDNIDVADICTCCECDTFFSHRVCGERRGNLALIVALK